MSEDEPLGPESEDEVEEVEGQGGGNVQRTPEQEATSGLALRDFRLYCLEALDYCPFTRDEITAIKLLNTLRKTKASLATYDSVMLWHLQSAGLAAEHETHVRQNPRYISPEKIYQHLEIRYTSDNSFLGYRKPSRAIALYPPVLESCR